MNAKHTKHLFGAFLILGLITAGTSTAFAADKPWWEFWNNNSTRNLPTPNSTPQVDSNIARDQNSIQNDQKNLHDLYQKIWQDKQSGIDPTADQTALQSLQQSMQNDRQQFQTDRQANQPNILRDQNSLQNDRQNMSSAYQKLQQDKRAGVDTTADQQAVDNLKQSYANDRAQYQADGGNVNQQGHNRRGGYGQQQSNGAPGAPAQNGQWNGRRDNDGDGDRHRNWNANNTGTNPAGNTGYQNQGNEYRDHERWNNQQQPAQGGQSNYGHRDWQNNNNGGTGAPGNYGGGWNGGHHHRNQQ